MAAYNGIPAGLLKPCPAVNVALETTRDLVRSRNAYKAALSECSLMVDKTLQYDAAERARAVERAKRGE